MATRRSDDTLKQELPPTEGQTHSSAPPPGKWLERGDDDGDAEPSHPLPDEIEFINDLSAADLVGELAEAELKVLSLSLGDVRGINRRIDLLAAYYDAGGDSVASLRRRKTDRFFVLRDQDSETAVTVVERLSEVLPELPGLGIQRIGDGEDSALLLCSGDQIAGVVDDYELLLDTDEVDLRMLEDRTLSVRSIVQAVNMLLERMSIEERMISLKSDLHREVYVAMNREAAERLAKASRIDEIDADETIEHACW